MRASYWKPNIFGGFFFFFVRPYTQILERYYMYIIPWNLDNGNWDYKQPIYMYSNYAEKALFSFNYTHHLAYEVLVAMLPIDTLAYSRLILPPPPHPMGGTSRSCGKIAELACVSKPYERHFWNLGLKLTPFPDELTKMIVYCLFQPEVTKMYNIAFRKIHFNVFFRMQYN